MLSESRFTRRRADPLAPWPCWSIAASTSADVDSVKSFLSALQPYVTQFNSHAARQKDDIDFVVDYFGHQRADVEEWLGTVEWEETLAHVEEKVVRDTLE